MGLNPSPQTWGVFLTVQGGEVVTHLVHTQKIAGAIPASATNMNKGWYKSGAVSGECNHTALIHVGQGNPG